MPTKDKQKQKEWARRHYEANKDKVKARAALNNKASKARNKEYIQQYLLTHPCIDCGNDNPIVLEFDHVRGEKCDDIARMKSQSFSLDTLKLEIEKCEVRCANCHRIVTHNRRVA